MELEAKIVFRTIERTDVHGYGNIEGDDRL